VSRDSVTLWTCDRCGATVNTRGGEQPKWLGLLFGAPPEAEPMDSKWVRKHLCKDCDRDFAAFIRPIARDAAAESKEQP